jgi:WD40 repeat protein
MFVSASKDTSAKLFDVDSLDCMKTYQTERPVNSASISPVCDHVRYFLYSHLKKHGLMHVKWHTIATVSIC